MIPSVVLTAALDRRLRGADLSLYLFLCTQLDVLTYRPVKHNWLSRRMGRQRRSVQRSLRALMTHGYLERGPYAEKLATYRIVANLAAADASSVNERRTS